MLPRHSACFAVVLVSLSCCGPATQKAENPNRVVLIAADAGELLRQCSRGAPQIGEAVWQPTDADIDALERALPAALAAVPEAHQVDFRDVLWHWHRQYVGLVRGGRRFVYGNFFPAEMTNGFEEWRKKPMIVCDGGPAFFGAEFDTVTGRITRLDFNGVA